MEMEEADCYASSILYDFCPRYWENLSLWYGYDYHAKAHTFAIENLCSGSYSGLIPSKVCEYQSTMQKALYRKLNRFSIGGEISTVRMELPECVVQKVRALYLSPTSFYMGFKEFQLNDKTLNGVTKRMPVVKDMCLCEAFSKIFKYQY